MTDDFNPDEFTTPPDEVLPEGLPEMARPPGADDWHTGDQRNFMDILPTAAAERDEQTNQAIEIINQGLAHESCTQLDGYSPHKFSAQIEGQHRILENIQFSNEEEYVGWIKELVDNADTVITWDKIEKDGMGVVALPGGERLCVFLPPSAKDFPTFSLRKHTAVKWPAKSFVERGMLTQNMMDFILRLVAAHVNIIFVGPMGAGKTSLLRAVAQEAIGSDEKIAVVEQVPELNINKPLAGSYIYQPTIEGMSLTQTLDFSLYNGLSRLIVGEVHIEGLSKMLETMILTEGSMSTYHAYSVEQAAERMKMGLQTEHTNISESTAANFLRQAVEVVIVIEKLDEVRRVTQITEIDWRASFGNDKFSGTNLFVFKDGQFQTTDGFPDPQGRVMKKMDKYNLTLPQEWFLNLESQTKFRRKP